MGCWSWRFPLGGKSIVQVQIKPGGGSCHYSWGFLYLLPPQTLVIATLIVEALLVVTLIATDPIGVWLATLHLALDQISRNLEQSLKVQTPHLWKVFFMKNLKFVQYHLVCFSLFEVAAGSIIAHYPHIKPNTSLFLAFLFHLRRWALIWWRNILNQSGKVRINMFFTGPRSPLTKSTRLEYLLDHFCSSRGTQNHIKSMK